MKIDRPVAEIMTPNPLFVGLHTPIDVIHRIFEKNTFHHLPVVHIGKVVGIISKSDYLKVQHMLTCSWSGTVGIQDIYKDFCAADIMSRQPLKIEPLDSIGLAADIFLVNKLHALPVVQDDELVGIVTSHDLLAYAFEVSMMTIC